MESSVINVFNLHSTSDLLICLFHFSFSLEYSCYDSFLVFLLWKSLMKNNYRNTYWQILFKPTYLSNAVFNMNTYICFFFLLVGHKPNHFLLVFPNFSFFLSFFFAFWKWDTDFKDMRGTTPQYTAMLRLIFSKMRHVTKL